MEEHQARPIIVWCGRFHTHDGYGTAARLHVGALRDIGVTVVAVDIESQTVVGPVDDAVIRFERGSDRLRLTAVDHRRPVTVVVHERPDRYPCVASSGLTRRVGYSYWETMRTPPEWVGRMLSMDRIWTSSEFNVDGFVASGLPAGFVDTVGHPVDPLLLDVAEGRGHRDRWNESTVFLSVVSSAVGRRDLSVLVEAYVRAFDHTSDVALIIKVPEGQGTKVQRVVDAVRETMPEMTEPIPKIQVIASTMNREQLVRLHASVDCYVSCERGNGWDLPAMDSLSLGVPVVATAFGASSTFLDPDDCYVVPTSARLVSADATLLEPHVLYSGHEWPYVDPGELETTLRTVDTGVRDRVERGRSARARILARYAGERVAHEVLSLVESAPDIEFRSAGHAVVEVSSEPTLWSLPFGRSPDQLASREDALVGILSDPAFLRPWRPAAAMRVYKTASRFAVQHRGAVGTGEVSRRLAKVMKSPSSAPLKKAIALGQLWTSVRAAGGARAEVGVAPDLRVVLEDYERCVAGARSTYTPVVAEEKRRELWRAVGPLETNPQDVALLNSLRDRHRGERVFVLGNGPSLLRCDLSRLDGEFTFAVNRIHLLFDRISWRPTYYTLLDWKMGATMADDIDQLASSTKFFPERFRGVLAADAQTYWYWERPFGVHVDDQFEPDIGHGIPSRSTVLVTAIQLACHLGFDDIVLIGVDASYSIPASVRQHGPDVFGTGTSLHLESTADDDPNHFDPTYFGRGARWHDPNPRAMRRDIAATARSAMRHGRRVRNATVGGALDEIERVDYDSLFEC